MQLSEFVTLSPEEKKRFVFSQGAPLAKRTDGDDCQVFLFQLAEFYLEIYFDIESKSVKKFLIYPDAKHLSLYFNAIRIDDLFRR